MTLASSNKKEPKNSQLAFTLVEILVVIAVIGLLSSIIFAITSGANEQGRIAKGLYFSQHLHNSLGSYIAGAWNFDEGSGVTANDTSGWDNNGTLYNFTSPHGFVTDTPSNRGYSLSFDGADDYVEFESTYAIAFERTDPFSFTGWIKTTNSGESVIVGKMNASDSYKGYALMSYGNGARLWIINHYNTNLIGAYGSVPGMNTSDGKWHYIVGTYDGSSNISGVNIYIDGILATKSTIFNSLSATIKNSVNLRVGMSSGHARMNGLIDEVRIYSTALTSAQIASKYYAGLDRLLVKGLMDKKEYRERLAKI
jgi:prepilin-type N-terminal cleavage/methylation domain-containing protein